MHEELNFDNLVFPSQLWYNLKNDGLGGMEMETERLMEIQERLAYLPALQERMNKLRIRIQEVEEDVRSLLRKYEQEALDVEQIKKDTLSTTILRMIGKYEGRVNKEVEEMMTAKMEYDKAAQRMQALHQERDELGSRIAGLRQEETMYERELRKREEEIQINVTSEISIRYRELEAEEKGLSRQLVEIDEAMKAARRVIATADTAIGHLSSAEGWATYDVWAKGGILSHMAKYDHIDNAQAACNRLQSQMKDLQKELSDVNLSAHVGLTGIDSTTRAVDFWFDNIFTDLKVRDKIRNDQSDLKSLVRKMEDIVGKLHKSHGEIKGKIAELERKKQELIISSK